MSSSPRSNIFSAIIFLYFALFANAREGDFHLTPEDFDTVVLKTNNIYVIEYYSAYCESCKQFVPVWEQFASYVENDFLVARVNVDTKTGSKLAKDQNILKQGIPAIQVVGGTLFSEVLMAGSIKNFHMLSTAIDKIADRYRGVSGREDGLLEHTKSTNDSADL